MHVKQQLPSLPAVPSILDDVVTREQSYDDVHAASARSIRDDDETIAQVNFITYTTTTLVEDDLKGMPPSSSTQPFPQSHSTYSNATHANIKRHA